MTYHTGPTSATLKIETLTFFIALLRLLFGKQRSDLLFVVLSQILINVNSPLCLK